MNRKEKDFKEQYYKKINGIVVTPIINFKNFINGEYIGLEIIKTSEEVYQEWLKNKDKNVVKEPTEQEEINSVLLQENANIRLQLAKQQKINAEIMKTLAELGGK